MCNRQALSLNISKKKKRVSNIERRKTLIRDVDLKKKEHLFSKKIGFVKFKVIRVVRDTLDVRCKEWD